MIVCLDADRDSLEKARNDLGKSIQSKGVDNVAPHEGVVILIARRNIESWLECLEGREANEDDDYGHRKGKEGEVGQAVKKMMAFVRGTESMPNDVLPSIRGAVEVIRRELLPDLSQA